MENTEYTVGWIAPLPLELSTARCALEHQHKDMNIDDDRYYGGRIGTHNIVIGVQGTIGTDAASDLAARMQAAFPNIKFFLVVGIGGGVPRFGVSGASSEIVLGDVVVSYPWGNHGGVVRYDCGAWMGEDQGRLNFVGHTNAPPQVLLRAVNNLRADFVLDGRQGTEIPTILAGMRSRLMESERHTMDDPGSRQDRLYPDHLSHPPFFTGVDCSNSCGPDFLYRHQRGSSAMRPKDTPKIHFGNIGSSNQLQISSAERNRLHNEHNIICFEMEGAGVIQSHPCLVIRGVCDYSDSHKNKVWQPYAAATAAAYAKELLRSMTTTGITADETHKLLSQLHVTDPRDDKRRIEETKGGLLDASCFWIFQNSTFQQWRGDDDKCRLLWVKGDPGKGKTMLLCGVTNELEKTEKRLAYFFCQATDPRINSNTSVLRGLLYFLVSRQPSLVYHIQKRYKSAGENLFKGDNAWFALSEILTNMLHDVNWGSRITYLIIDALDECVSGLPILLNFISQSSSRFSRIKWFVSSRNDIRIEKGLKAHGSSLRLSLELKENAAHVVGAVNAYINHCVSELAASQQYDQFLRNQVQQKFQEKANGTFLWVSLVVKELEDTMAWEVLQVLEEIPTSLKDLYFRMLEQIRQLKRQYPDICQRVLRTVLTAYRPLHLRELYILSQLPTQSQNEEQITTAIVKQCGSFLTIRDKQVYIIHQSATDFLRTDANHVVFPHGTRESHKTIFNISIHLMFKTLRRDIYCFKKPGFSAEAIEAPMHDPLIPCRYSCFYWIDHFCECDASLLNINSVEKFFKEKYLHWLEALSLYKSISKGATSMAKLNTLVQTEANMSNLIELIYDAYRFIIYHESAIANNPLQVYASALLFSPNGSLTKMNYKNEEPEWMRIKFGIDDSWNACLQSLEAESNPVAEMVFSFDSAWLATAYPQGKVRVWEVGTSECRTILNHGPITSMAFSHDSTRLAVATNRTIKLWHVSTGSYLQSLEHCKWWCNIISIIFAHDTETLIIATSSGLVFRWNLNDRNGIQLRQVIFPERPHRTWSPILSNLTLTFDSIWLLTVTSPNAVEIRDISSGSILELFNSNIREAQQAAFSPDMVWLATMCSENRIRIWDVRSGECIRVINDRFVPHGYHGPVTSLSFSPDSSRLASTFHGGTVKIWEPTSGECLRTLEGHSSGVWLAAFSYDSALLASASKDCTVKIWDISDTSYPQVKYSHKQAITSFAFSSDSSRLASASIDDEIKIWDTVTGAHTQTLKERKPFSHAISFSDDLPLLAAASDGLEMHIWNLSSGYCVRSFPSTGDYVFLTAFSHDAVLLASMSCDEVRIWEVRSGNRIRTIGSDSKFLTVTFSPNTAYVAGSLVNKTIQVWDIAHGHCIHTVSMARNVFQLSFDVSVSCLRTEYGSIDLISRLTSAESLSALEHCDIKKRGLGMTSDRAWITYNSENLVRLPLEYRSGVSMMFRNHIAIGSKSGRVAIYELVPDRLLLSDRAR